MLFNSYIFIFIFLPLTLVGYFAINGKGHYRLALGYLVLMSLWFYGYFNYYYLAIISCSVVVNYLVGVVLGRTKEKVWRKISLILGISINLGCLFYFKYYDFFVSNLNALFKTDICLQNVVLPLGISFFTFQQISYIVDCYKEETADYDFLEYAAYVTFFPQLIAGPIVLHSELVPQLLSYDNKKVNWDNLSKGMYRFTIGLSKKVLLADILSQYVSYGFDNLGSLSRMDAVVCILFYAFQIYFDFSGYCDMAVGIGYMFNLTLPENFIAPYKARNIEEFWDGWHKTLTRFFTKYVYIPMGGNRKGRTRTLFNTFAVFFISGIWHGANWTFILWGSIHGTWMLIHKIVGNKLKSIPDYISKIWTFMLVSISWVYFRADSITDANKMLRNVFINKDNYLSEKMMDVSDDIVEARLLMRLLPDKLDHITAILLLIIVAFIIVVKGKTSQEICNKFTFSKKQGAIVIILLVWSIVSFSGVTEFLYFNF